MELRLHAALAAAEAREHAGEEEAEEVGRRLREVFRERAISIRTMDGPLRVVTAVALAQIVVAAVFVGLRDASMPTTALSTLEGEQTAIGTPIFWVAVASLSLAWAYALGGLLHGHRLARVGGLCLYTAATYALWDGPFPLASARMAPSYVLLAAVWAIGVLSLRPAAGERERQRLRVAAVPVLTLLGVALYLAYWWRLRPYHDERFFSIAVLHQLQLAQFALVPVLLVAGIDFAEWGDVASSRAAELVRRVRSPLWPGALVAAVAGGALASTLTAASLGRQARGVGLAALLVAVVAAAVAAARRRRLPAAHVPYAALFATGVVLYGILLGVSYAAASPGGGSPTAAYRHPETPRFQLEYPVSWLALPPDRRGPLQAFTFEAPETQAQFLVIAVPPSVAPLFVPSFRQQLLGGPVVARRHERGWQVTEQRGPAKQALLWQRSAEGRVWLLVGWTAPARFAQYAPAFEEIAASWTTEVAGGEGAAAAGEPARPTGSDRTAAISALALFALALLAAAVLLARRLPRPGWLAGSAVFVLAVGLLFALVQLPIIGFALLGLSPHALPGLGFGDVQTLVALATLATLAVLALLRPQLPRLRELLLLLLVLNGGLLAIYWIDRGFVGGMSAGGRFSVVQAALVLAALVWDVVMSGEAITNRHNRHFPRHTRVLVYLGYVILVATAVLFFSSLRVQATNASIEPQFESEGWVDAGLALLGTSLLVTLFVLRLSRARLRRAESG